MYFRKVVIRSAPGSAAINTYVRSEILIQALHLQAQCTAKESFCRVRSYFSEEGRDQLFLQATKLAQLALGDFYYSLKTMVQ